MTARSLIAGRWTAPDTDGPLTAAMVDDACRAAEAAFLSYGWSRRESRARFLETIAAEIDARGEAITEIATAESGLPAARLIGERGRTTGQLRLFAAHIRDGAYLDRRHDPALPDRFPAPRPDLRMVQRPVGPVAVFGASNFPLAFSTAGGDTASALAAGCTVVVKGHPAHPGTSEIVAQAIAAAIAACGIDPGIFSLIQDAGHTVGTALVQHPLIRAVGFTGSLRAGRALFDLCAARREPIPFFGELGSVNPVFILPHAADARLAAIARDWAASVSLGAGQFCTNPGVVVLPRDHAEAFGTAAAAALAGVAPQVMLTPGIAGSFRDGAASLAASGAVAERLHPTVEGREATPGLYTTSAQAFLADRTLGAEIFGPSGLIVACTDAGEMHEVAGRLEGQLTCTLQLVDDDFDAARALVPILERKAGRLLFNGFPTGVEVADAMVHGGPYPASTNFGATSVGTLAIRRFLRPVCFQSMPDELLPDDLRSVS